MEVVVEMEEAVGHVSDDALPTEEGTGGLLVVVAMSSLRAELLPACLSVLMISGTWRGGGVRKGWWGEKRGGEKNLA